VKAIGKQQKGYVKVECLTVEFGKQASENLKGWEIGYLLLNADSTEHGKDD
jgi:hypothetical protein